MGVDSLCSSLRLGSISMLVKQYDKSNGECHTLFRRMVVISENLWCLVATGFCRNRIFGYSFEQLLMSTVVRVDFLIFSSHNDSPPFLE